MGRSEYALTSDVERYLVASDARKARFIDQIMRLLHMTPWDKVPVVEDLEPEPEPLSFDEIRALASRPRPTVVVQIHNLRTGQILSHRREVTPIGGDDFSGRSRTEREVERYAIGWTLAAHGIKLPRGEEAEYREWRIHHLALTNPGTWTYASVGTGAGCDDGAR